jgi:hypothetical protein
MRHRWRGGELPGLPGALHPARWCLRGRAHRAQDLRRRQGAGVLLLSNASPERGAVRGALGLPRAPRRCAGVRPGVERPRLLMTREARPLPPQAAPATPRGRRERRCTRPRGRGRQAAPTNGSSIVQSRSRDCWTRLDGGRLRYCWTRLDAHRTQAAAARRAGDQGRAAEARPGGERTPGLTVIDLMVGAAITNLAGRPAPAAWSSGPRRFETRCAAARGRRGPSWRG